MMANIDNRWSVGAIVSAVMAGLAVISSAASGLYFTAKVADAVSAIPQIQMQVTKNTMDIAVLQDKQSYGDARYQEIIGQLTTINAKLDNQQRDLYNAGFSRPDSKK